MILEPETNPDPIPEITMPKQSVDSSWVTEKSLRGEGMQTDTGVGRDFVYGALSIAVRRQCKDHSYLHPGKFVVA